MTGASMCKIIKTKNETLALILRAQYVNEIWKKDQVPLAPESPPEEIKTPPHPEAP